MTNQRIVIEGVEYFIQSSCLIAGEDKRVAILQRIEPPKPDPFAEGQKLTMEPFAKVDRLIMGLTGLHSDDRFLLKQIARAIVEVCKKECGKL